MKKIFSVITAVCIMALTFITTNINVNAADIQYLTVFGDSIPDGYGLSNPNLNFVNLLAEEYDLTMDIDAYNFAVSGATSSEILGQIKSTDSEILQNSDTIIISAGGNDILNTYGAILLEMAGKYQTELEEAGVRLNYTSPINMLSQVTSLFFDPDKAEIILKIFDDAVSESAKAQYNNAVASFNQNMNEMVSYIRNIGSQADIYFLTLYNPISVFSIDVEFFNNLDESIADMQKDVLALADSSDKIHVVDVLDDFSGHYSEWTRIYQFDIHPNENGHSRIYSLINNAVQGLDTPKEPIQEQASENPDTSDISNDSVQTSVQDNSQPNYHYMVWIITGSAVLLVAVIVIVIIAKHSD